MISSSEEPETSGFSGSFSAGGAEGGFILYMPLGGLYRVFEEVWRGDKAGLHVHRYAERASFS